MNEGKNTNSNLILAAVITAILGPLIVYLGIRVIDAFIPPRVEATRVSPTQVAIVETAIASNATPDPQIVPTSAPVATPVPTVSISRPPRINIVIGGNHSIPLGDWTWVCTGDFSITLTDGTKKALYDVGVSNTGLTLILQPNSSFTLDGPFEMNQGLAVGDCYPYSQSEKDSAVSSAISAQFNKGCGSKCQYVNVIELDEDGNELNNYWTPQQP